MLWCRSSQITSLFTDSLRSLHARASISIGPHSPAGWVQPANLLRPWSMRSGSMSWLDRRSTATTPQFQCLHPVTAGPKPAVSGPMFVMIGPRHRQLLRLFGSFIRKTARENIAAASQELLRSPAGGRLFGPAAPRAALLSSGGIPRRTPGCRNPCPRPP